MKQRQQHNKREPLDIDPDDVDWELVRHSITGALARTRGKDLKMPEGSNNLKVSNPDIFDEIFNGTYLVGAPEPMDIFDEVRSFDPEDTATIAVTGPSAEYMKVWLTHIASLENHEHSIEFVEIEDNPDFIIKTGQPYLILRFEYIDLLNDEMAQVAVFPVEYEGYSFTWCFCPGIVKEVSYFIAEKIAAKLHAFGAKPTKSNIYRIKDMIVWPGSLVYSGALTEDTLELYIQRIKDTYHGLTSATTSDSQIEVTQDWLGLRDAIHDLGLKKGLSERDATICAWYAVPEEPRMTKVDTKKALAEVSDEIKNMRQPTFDAVTRRKLDDKSLFTNTDLGRLGEKWVYSLLSLSPENGQKHPNLTNKDGDQKADVVSRIPSPVFVGSEPQGVCDISDAESGTPEDASWAINVKLSLEEEVNRTFNVTPEHDVPSSWVLLVVPRLLQLHLYPITGEQQSINTHSPQQESMRLCVAPEELGKTVAKLISGEIEI